jgi:hypothetical protein
VILILIVRSSLFHMTLILMLFVNYQKIQGIDRVVELKTDISMKLHCIKIMYKSLQQRQVNLPLVPYCTNQFDKHLFALSFLPH